MDKLKYTADDLRKYAKQNQLQPLPGYAADAISAKDARINALESDAEVDAQIIRDKDKRIAGLEARVRELNDDLLSILNVLPIMGNPAFTGNIPLFIRSKIEIMKAAIRAENNPSSGQSVTPAKPQPSRPRPRRKGPTT